jgi:hypothetical protein
MINASSGRSSDLLPWAPSSRSMNSDRRWARLKEFTAAGQFRNYTGFPFNLYPSTLTYIVGWVLYGGERTKSSGKDKILGQL